MKKTHIAGAVLISAACAMPAVAQTGSDSGSTTYRADVQEDRGFDPGWLGLLGLAGLLGLRRKEHHHDTRFDTPRTAR